MIHHVIRRILSKHPLHRWFWAFVPLWLLLPSGILCAQQDTIALQPVTVVGFAPERFMAGLKIQRIDSTTLQQFRFQNLGDLLAFNTPLAFKNYGPGQLNTVAFRGTSSMHTAVLWNGLNINQPNLGQTDFSTLPVAGFDRLSVQYGSSASVVGTDAVGGSILLESAGIQPTGLRVLVGRQQGSFGNQQTQAGASYGLKTKESLRLSGKTLYYDGRMNNRYPYAERRGLLLWSLPTAVSGVSCKIWCWRAKTTGSCRPTCGSPTTTVTLTPENPTTRELTRTQSRRAMLQYQTPTWTWRTAWIRDLIDFGGGDLQNLEHTGTDRFLTRLEKEMESDWAPAAPNLHLRVGGEVAHYRTRVEGYTEPLITENRADLFVLEPVAAYPALAGIGHAAAGVRDALRPSPYSLVGHRVPADRSDVLTGLRPKVPWVAATGYLPSTSATGKPWATPTFAPKVASIKKLGWKPIGNPRQPSSLRLR